MRREIEPVPRLCEKYENMDQKDASSKKLENLYLIPIIRWQTFKFNSRVKLFESAVTPPCKKQINNKKIPTFGSTQHMLLYAEYNQIDDRQYAQPVILQIIFNSEGRLSIVILCEGLDQ